MMECLRSVTALVDRAQPKRHIEQNKSFLFAKRGDSELVAYKQHGVSLGRFSRCTLQRDKGEVIVHQFRSA